MQYNIDQLHSLPIDKLLEIFKSSRQKGLCSEAVATSRKLYGANLFPKQSAQSFGMLFLNQFLNPLIYLLIIAAGLILFFSTEKLDVFIISGVIIFNTFLGALQEWRTQSLLHHLEQLTNSFCLVIRNGVKDIIPEAELVCGDILCIQPGQRMAVDARIISAENIVVDEASLTGESKPVDKKEATLKAEVHIFERQNMLFCGTMVMSGFGLALVCAVGKKTQLGICVDTVTSSQPEIPLQVELGNLTYWLVVFIFGLCVFLFFTGFFTGKPAAELFTMLTGLFICVVPEGLPVVLTLILVTGVYHMAKKHALVKSMQVVETLGRTCVILTDKTGTITHNQMMVSVVYANKARWVVEGSGYSKEGNIKAFCQEIPLNTLNKLATVCLLMNRSSMVAQEGKAPLIVGDPLEIALAIFGTKVGISLDQVENEYHLVFDIGFDSKVKYHAALYRNFDKYELFIIGAPEVLIQKSNTDFSEQYIAFLNEGLRVVAVGWQRVLIKKDTFEELSTEEKRKLIHTYTTVGSEILGLCGMQDSIRKEVAFAIKKAKDAGVKVVMLTGDHAATAQYVSLSIGLSSGDSQPIDGYNISSMSDEELDEVLDYTTVYARLSPSHKVRILQAFQKRGLVVAMIGDGVNDIPSLTIADVGIVMGSMCTDSAREAASIILLNDSFMTVVEAIGQGRHIFYTLKRVVLYFFSTNLAEILIIVFAFFFDAITGKSLPLPLTAAQILWLNLVTDGCLDIGISMEKEEPALMKPSWPKKSHHLIDMQTGVRALLSGSIMALFSLSIFIMYYPYDLAYARTMTLVTMALFQWFNAWNCRSDTISIFKLGLYSNLWFLGISFFVLALQWMLVYWPSFNYIFKTAPLSPLDYFYAICCATIIIFVEELRKWLVKK